jgi:KaiC/GvpD/RAD55 family RecA-like ATPase
VGWALKDVLADEKEKKSIKKTVKDSFVSDQKLKEVEEPKDRIKKPNTLSTGIDLLDKNLDGGLPAGSFVCLYGDPASTPEAFLYQFSTERETYYVNTTRSPDSIRKDIKDLHLEDDFITFIDVYSLNHSIQNGEDERIMNFVFEKLDEISNERINVIIDNLTFFMDLNVDERMKLSLLDALYRLSKKTDGLVIVYIIKDSIDEKTLKKVYDISDVIIEVMIEISGSRYVKKFGIPKIRGRTPLSDLFKFEVGEGVQLDTSRDIA